MKTSRYIHLTILVFIFGATLALFINAKKNTKQYAKNVISNYKQQKLPPFTVLVVKESASISLNNGNHSVSSYTLKNNNVDEKFIFDNYLVKNDTLFIDKVNTNYTISVAAKNLKSIIGLEKSKVNLSRFYADSLQIDLTKSRLTGYLRADSINYFSLNAKKQSYVNINRPARIIRIDNVTKKETVIIENANLKNATIILKDKTKLWMPKPKNVTIKTDSLSTYNLSN